MFFIFFLLEAQTNMGVCFSCCWAVAALVSNSERCVVSCSLKMHWHETIQRQATKKKKAQTQKEKTKIVEWYKTWKSQMRSEKHSSFSLYACSVRVRVLFKWCCSINICCCTFSSSSSTGQFSPTAFVVSLRKIFLCSRRLFFFLRAVCRWL